MIYGYTRVSTELQNIENQHYEILAFAKAQKITINKWVDEVISSKKSLKERRLGKLLNQLKKGDILIASELSRLGRNLLEIMGILQHCLERDCQIWTIKENYKLGVDIQSKVLAFAFSLAAEIERQLISQRTKESLKRIKEEGKHLGRPFGFNHKKLDLKKDKIKELLSLDIPKAEIARLMNCSWITLHRYIQRAL